MNRATVFITAGLAFACASADARGFIRNPATTTPLQVVAPVIAPGTIVRVSPIAPAGGSSSGGCGVSASVTGTPTATGSSAYLSATAYLAPNGVCSTTLITRP